MPWVKLNVQKGSGDRTYTPQVKWNGKRLVFNAAARALIWGKGAKRLRANFFLDKVGRETRVGLSAVGGDVVVSAATGDCSSLAKHFAQIKIKPQTMPLVTNPDTGSVVTHWFVVDESKGEAKSE